MLAHLVRTKNDVEQAPLINRWTSRTRERQAILKGLLKNIPVNEHMRGLQELGRHGSQEMLKIKVIYSRSNQLISYRHVEEIVKATKANK